MRYIDLLNLSGFLAVQPASPKASPAKPPAMERIGRGSSHPGVNRFGTSP